MSTNLVIVESPAKAKTIEGFLGKEFKVMSSYGHIRDLPKNNQAIDIANNFEPTYQINDDKKKIINDLKRAVKIADTVWLASDGDREGEAIAWHLEEALDLAKKNTKRIVFHEITQKAILHAVANPKEIDRNLVNGQQARRVLDRLVGFELSPVLWKKIQVGLSAGRVQSVAVRLIVEREREINKFEASTTFKISAKLSTENNEVFDAKLPKDKADLEDARIYLEDIKNKALKIYSIEQKPGKRSPKAPFTTSTLQQLASQQLGFSVRQTMSVAQRLYESGKITYMRTDSVNLSDSALEQSAKYIIKTYGKEYHQKNIYKTKSNNAQEAHEAIRPTDFNQKQADKKESQEQKLYDLIWRRALASQMSDAQLQKTVAKIEVDGEVEMLQARGEIISFVGFLEVVGKTKQDEDVILPDFKVGDKLNIQSLRAQESFARAPARFTEASLVRTLEELGIGRPSTYAPTVATIQNRGYIEKGFDDGIPRLVRILAVRNNKIINEDKTETTGSNKGKLVPNDIAGIVTDFLVKNFSEVVDFNFTAKVESQFDEIANGNLVWQKMIDEFYQPFHQDIIDAENISREDANQTRILGTDPKSGKPVSVRTGRFGSFAQIGHRDDEEKPRFASLMANQRLESVSLEEVLPLFDLPRQLGKTKKGESVMVNSGRFGPYAQFVDDEVVSYLEQKAIKGIDIVSQNVSIGEEDPHTVELATVLDYIDSKIVADRDKEIKLFQESTIQILDGRWGPFITDGFKNAKIPKDQAPEKLTLKECKSLIESTKKVKKRLTKSYHGGGFILLRDPKTIPTVTLKVKDKKEKKAQEIADELETKGKSVRLISARGAAMMRVSEKRKK